MQHHHASQIANLLNSRNQLARGYDANSILQKSDDFLYELRDDKVVACIEVKRVQWYQWEVLHLSVDSAFENQGLGRSMIRQAEEKVTSNGARILQCTIRSGNIQSEHVFRGSGFNQVSTFYYPQTGNDVAVWQKVVSHRPQK